ncbi:serine/threonine-protein kinase [Nocardioides sp.]|uniref:serine/threonine-protein kinase n=1 Tax=Nocardioides sp. TaxID=35761 RepID=UPI002BFC5928|nr:serine/threonine-protein kinase [Nocardioides sp.]HXH79865.1 serine/threonine-protein kinase [Nocardioides sp.]
MTGEGSGHAAWKPPAPTAAEPVRDTLDGYSDLREIGVGGDSVVYRARENSLGREVAIKVLNVADDVRAARFAREVEITLDLGRQHPNIVTVLATGITGSGRPAIVMEFYPDGTLHDRLKQLGPLPVEEVVRVGLVLADALSFAHGRGVLHRDVKPQNVLVLPTSWVLADFGIARLADSEHTSSVETFTYRHASPQVLDGHAPTAADDVWSLGSTLYTLVDGRPPFASDDPDEDSALAYLRRVRTEEHRPLVAPGAEALAELIGRCLAKDTADRWSAAGELHDALLGLRHRAWEPGGKPPAAPPTPQPAAPRAEQHRSDGAPSDGAPSDRTGQGWAPSAGSDERPPTDRTSPREQRDSGARAPVAEDWEGAPAPVALSAAAHVPAAASKDAEPTGMGLPEEHRAQPGAVDLPSVGEDAAASPTGRRRLVIGLGVLALVVGTALGVAGSVLRDKDSEQSPAPDDDRLAGRSIPTFTGEPEEDDPTPDVADPALKPVFTGLTYKDGKIVASWTDPSDGEATFHMSQSTPETALLKAFEFGQTETEFAYLLPPRRSCYVVGLIMPDGALGVSKPRCLTNKSG